MSWPDGNEHRVFKCGKHEEISIPAPVHHGKRILPDVVSPAQTWVENEEMKQLTDSRINSAEEKKSLLSSYVQKQTHLRVPLAVGVKEIKKCTICPQIVIKHRLKVKSKFQERKEKFIEVLKLPYFIINMITVIVLVHVCGPKTLKGWLEWPTSAWWREPWRLFTYSFIHVNVNHLFTNVIFALVVGWRLEREQSWARVAVVWAVGVAAGALGAGALQPRVSVVGASAAVYALLTAHLPNICLRFGHVPLWWFRPLSVVVLGASEGCWALLRVPEDGANYDHVAWAAHVLGAAVGIPLGFLVFTGENITNIYIRTCRVLSTLLLLVGVLLTVIHYVFWYQVDPYT